MNSVEVSSVNSGRLYDLLHKAWESEARIEHHSEVLNTLCWWDLITKYID